MGIGHPPRNRKDRRRGGNNVVSLRHPNDDFFDVLSPLLEEIATVEGEESFTPGSPQRAVARERECPASRRLRRVIEPPRRLARSPVGGRRTMRSQQGVSAPG